MVAMHRAAKGRANTSPQVKGIGKIRRIALPIAMTVRSIAASLRGHSIALNVFIFTMSGDYHARVLGEALRRRGHSVTLHRDEDTGTVETLQFHADDAGTSACVEGSAWRVELSRVDVAWNRRSRLARAAPGVDPRDRSYCNQQLRFATGALRRLMPQAFWINPEAAARDCDSKPLQLQLAGRCGLRIPDTLVSNCPDAIRAFLDLHDRVIYKPLMGHVWREHDVTRSSYTARVSVRDLPPDQLVRAVPGIFQVQVEKQFEVRAQFFGDTSLAVRIESSQLSGGEFDWRPGQAAISSAEPIDVPPGVHAACRALMKAIGVVSGAFDFIVTPSGQWIFLEVNEGGQFLFLEQWAPQLPVVDAFCAFVEARRSDFKYRPPDDPLRFARLAANVPDESARSPAQAACIE